MSEKRRKRKGRRRGRKERERKKRMGCRAASLNWSDDGEIHGGFREACFGDDVMQRQPGALGREEGKREPWRPLEVNITTSRPKPFQ